MRYNEVEELESTKEWLLRFNEAGFSDELLYVPSQLSKLGVAPIDVVDRLDYLKSVEPGPNRVDHAILEAAEPEEPAVEEDPEEESTPEGPEPQVIVEMLEVRPLTPVAEPVALSLDYDSYGAWEWMEPIEKMVEESFLSMLAPEPDLPDFNALLALVKPQPTKPRSRGKRARARATRVAATTQLVGSSAGAIA